MKVKNILNWFKKKEQNNYLIYLFCALVFALLMSTVLNVAFYKHIIAQKIGIKMVIVCFFILLFNYLAIFFILSFRHIGKYILYILTYLAIVAEYYMLSTKTSINSGVMRSIFETNISEVMELIDAKLVIFGITLAIIIAPFFFFFEKKIYTIPLHKEILLRVFGVILSLFFSLGLIGLNYTKFSIFARQNGDFGFINVDNFIFGSFKVIESKSEKPKTLNIVDENPIQRKKDNKRHFVVFLVGETSRKASYSLNGYSRKTNPKLEKQDIVNFTKATSCGTCTAHSVPCMFSFKTRKEYKDSEVNENVLDILLKTGNIAVSWYENDDSSPKRQANNKKIEYTDLANKKHLLCKNRRCFDEILIEKLNDEINKFVNEKNQNDRIVVLHMIGSHGPLYYKRYPRKWAKFQPECTNANPSNCSIEELKNAYDNTIVYQDFVLSEIIDKLRLMKKQQKQVDITMIYVSDHGESLGEKGVFLHTFPYKIAPKEQIEIPFIIWTTNADLKAKFKTKSNFPVSHDNLSHTLLGIFDVESKAKDDSLDLTK